MRARQLHILLILSISAAMTVACSDGGDSPNPVTDTGVPADDGSTDDGGARDADDSASDVGPGEDIGFADSGPDAGIDTGVAPDTGIFDDATVPDSGVFEDAGISSTCNPAFLPGGACGGSIVGTWNYAAACGQVEGLQELQAVCPANVTTALSRTATGTATFRTDRTYSFNAEDVVEATVDVDGDCVTALNGCVGVEEFFQTNGVLITCATVGGRCLCDVTFAVAIQEQGSYSTSGDQFTTEAAAVTVHDYCVNAGTLRYRPVDEPTTFVLTP